MENFKFRLQRVLDIKIKNEEESKIKYSKAQNEKRVVEKELDDLKQMYKKYENEIDIRVGSLKQEEYPLGACCHVLSNIFEKPKLSLKV